MIKPTAITIYSNDAPFVEISLMNHTHIGVYYINLPNFEGKYKLGSAIISLHVRAYVTFQSCRNNLI